MGKTVWRFNQQYWKRYYNGCCRKCLYNRLFKRHCRLRPRARGRSLTQNSGAGVYISKLDAHGNFVWAKQFESWNIVSHAIALDAAGNVYTTGFFQQIADFDPGPGVYNLTVPIAIGSHGFICKLDNGGNFVWAKQIGGNGNFYLGSYDLKIDAGGNIITTGYFNGTADFDPGPTVLNLSSAGFDDNYVLKLDGNGNLVWVKQFSGASYGSGEGVSVDATGTIYSTGSFQGSVDFDPGPATFNLTSSPTNNCYISKLDGNGNFLWAKQVTGAAVGTGRSISVDATAHVFITGYFRGTADFDPGPSVFNMSVAGGIDLFIMKLDGSGNFLWAKHIGGSMDDDGKELSLDTSGNIYLTGFFQNSVDFDPGPATTNQKKTKYSFHTIIFSGTLFKRSNRQYYVYLIVLVERWFTLFM